MSSSEWRQKGCVPDWRKTPKQDRAELWREISQTTSEDAPDSFIIGKSVSTGSDVYLSPEHHLGTHLHLLGPTGVGKSSFLEGVLKELIRRGHGLCLITPHRDIYDHILTYCAHLHASRPELGLARRVIPFDIDESRHILGFNPVARNARVMTYQVVALMEAIRKSWGQANFNDTPLLARWLFNTSYGVVEPGLTLLQATRLVDSKPHPLRSAIAARIRNTDIRDEWQWIIKQNIKLQQEELRSAYLRFREFVMHERLRAIFGQHTNTLDFGSVLEGKILLVNLSQETTISRDNQRLLGTLLVNEILTAAFARREGNRRPFYLAIDEFQQFVTKDICEILSGGRKFGLHLILAHQILEQLIKSDEEVYYSTLANARTKVVFGGLSTKDLETMGSEMFYGELDPDLVKHEIWRTIYRPVETTRIVVTDSESGGGGEQDGYVDHESLANHEVYIPGSAWGELYPQSVSVGASRGRSTSRSQNSNWQRGRSTSLVPFYEHYEDLELASRTYRPIEEQLFLKMQQLKAQPPQHAAFLVPGQKVDFMRIDDLKHFSVSNQQLDEFRHECFETAACFKAPQEVEAQIEALERKLLTPGPIIIDATATPSDPPPSPGASVADDDSDHDPAP
jgi:hypothetical protein